MSRSLLVDLEFVRTTQAGDAFAFRFTPQEYLLRSAGGGFETIRIDWSPELLQDLVAVRQPGRDPAVVQRMGEVLRAALQPSGWPVREAAIAAAAREGRAITLTLRSAAAELYALPWELLILKATGQHLGELPTLLLRYEWPETGAAPAEPDSQREHGRILFAWSAAGGAVPASDQLAAIGSASRTGSHPFDPARDVLPHVSCSRLLAALTDARKTRTPISVLHLLCHGTAAGQTFGLALDDDSSGGAAVVDAARLRQLLSPFAGMVRLVVLTACDSGNSGALGNHLGSLAQTLHRAGFAQVVASRYPLSVSGSVKLTRSFYGSLLGGPTSVEQSLLKARRDISADPGQLDWASLQLYAHADGGTDSRPISFRPYRGLLAFQPEHRRFFFGRSREVAELLSDWKSLRDQNQPLLLAIDGASGTGKSSVLFAGALPELLSLQGPGTAAVRLRPGRNPEAALSEALAARSAGTPLLLLIDQFEELFTHAADPAARQRFARELWKLVSCASREIGCVFTIRSDFVGRCGELVLDDSGLRLDRIIYDPSHRVSVAQMDPAQLRAVIEEPAHRVGLVLESGLVERLLSDVVHEAGALPLLADTLDVLWLRRQGSTLTQAAYDEVGGVTGALHGRAEQLIAALSEEEQLQARRLLVRLGHGLADPISGTRVRMPVALLRPADPVQARPFANVLARLAEARLLVFDLEQGQESVEVAHEALLRKWPRLTQWAKEDQQLILQHETLERWVRDWKQHGALLSTDQLGYIAMLGREYELTISSEARQLLTASREERQRAEERERFARDCQRMLAVIALDPDFTREAAVLSEVESADPLAVPGWLQVTTDILHSGALMCRELVHSDSVQCANFSPDGEAVVTACVDGTARVWSVKGGESEAPLVLSGHDGPLNWAAFSPDGAQIVTASADQTACIFTLKGSRRPLVLSGHEGSVYCASYSPDGKTIATASADRTVRLWQSSSGDALRVLKGHTEEVYEVFFSPSGTQLLTSSGDGIARLWNLSGRGQPRVFGGKDELVRAASFSPDGKRIALAFASGEVRIQDLQGPGKPLILNGQSEWPYSIAWHPNGSQIVTASADRESWVWGTGGISLPIMLRGHGSAVLSAHFSPDGRRIVTAAGDGLARIFDTTRTELSTPRELEAADESSFLWSLDEDGPLPEEIRSPDGSMVLTLLPDSTARLRHQREAGGATLRLSGHTAPIGCAAFSPDGRRIITGAGDWQARVWNTDGSGEPLVLAGHTGSITLVAFSPDGEKLLTMSDDGTTRLWGEGGRSDVLLNGKLGRGVALSPDWKRIVTQGPATTRFVWELDLDPASLKSRLARATPYRLSIAERKRYLREPHDTAVQNFNKGSSRARRPLLEP